MEKKNLEGLKNLEHEELCVLVEEGKITWADFVKAQPESYPGYEEWVEENGLKDDDESAHRFIDMMEAECETENAGMVATVMEEVNRIKKTVASI